MKGENTMNKKKKLTINCEICDTRKLSEKSYEEYEQIILNAETVIVNERSKELFNKLNIVCNAEKFIEVENDRALDIPVIKRINGSCSIGSAVPREDNTVLKVNGTLTICPKAEEALRHYLRISVNGSVICPESMSGCLTRVSVNGSAITYPDDYTLLSNNFVIDKYFPLRAADNGKYFVPNTVKLFDKEASAAILAEKNVRFKAKKLLIPEEKIEEFAPLFDETTQFIVAPRGFSVVDGSAKLDDELVKKYGKNIFIYGNLDAKGDISDIAARIEKLIITGKVTLTAKSAAVFEKISAEYKKSEIVKEVIWDSQASAALTNDCLNISKEGISITNTGVVTVAEDIAPEDITRLVDLKNIGAVVCSEEQIAAVKTVGTNIGEITTEPIENLISLIEVINAEKYVM